MYCFFSTLDGNCTFKAAEGAMMNCENIRSFQLAPSTLFVNRLHLLDVGPVFHLQLFYRQLMIILKGGETQDKNVISVDGEMLSFKQGPLVMQCSFLLFCIKK